MGQSTFFLTYFIITLDILIKKFLVFHCERSSIDGTPTDFLLTCLIGCLPEGKESGYLNSFCQNLFLLDYFLFGFYGAFLVSLRSRVKFYEKRRNNRSWD